MMENKAEDKTEDRTRYRTEIFETDKVLVDVPMPIVTDRLIIRPPQSGDGKALSEAKKESWNDLKPWLPFAKGSVDNVCEKEDEVLCCQKHADFLLRDDLMLFAFDKETGKLIASSGLHRMDWQIRYFEIGYWVRSTETGKGYGSEITVALARYAFEAMQASKVVVGHHGGNAASQRIIEKLGFEKEAEFKRNEAINGRFLDVLYYARFNADGLPELNLRWGQGS